MLISMFALQPAHYDNVPTKRREYTEDSNQVGPTACSTQVADLQKQVGGCRAFTVIILRKPVTGIQSKLAIPQHTVFSADNAN